MSSQVIGRVTQVAQLEDADHALRRGGVYAVVDLGGTPTIRYAGAQGPQVRAQ